MVLLGQVGVGLLGIVGGRSDVRLGAELKDGRMVECWSGLDIIIVKRQSRLLERLGAVLSADWRIRLCPSLARSRVHLRSLSLSRWWLW